MGKTRNRYQYSHVTLIKQIKINDLPGFPENGNFGFNGTDLIIVSEKRANLFIYFCFPGQEQKDITRTHIKQCILFSSRDFETSSYI